MGRTRDARIPKSFVTASAEDVRLAEELLRRIEQRYLGAEGVSGADVPPTTDARLDVLAPRSLLNGRTPSKR